MATKKKAKATLTGRLAGPRFFKVTGGMLVVEELEQLEPAEPGIPSRGLEDMPIRIPKVKIVKPKDKAVVRGIINITAQVAKPTEIVKVELFLDAALYGVVTVPKKDEFLFQLNTHELISGSSYVLSAAAYDKFGGRFASPNVSIRINN